jgi:hypothetical protein
VTVAVGENPVLEALALDARVAATSSPMSISSQRGHDYAARWAISHGMSWSGAAAILWQVHSFASALPLLVRWATCPTAC